jgi:hypothetical protein
MTAQVSHPYKTTGRVMELYILIFTELIYPSYILAPLPTAKSCRPVLKEMPELCPHTTLALLHLTTGTEIYSFKKSLFLGRNARMVADRKGKKDVYWWRQM